MAAQQAQQEQEAAAADAAAAAGGGEPAPPKPPGSYTPPAWAGVPAGCAAVRLMGRKRCRQRVPVAIPETELPGHENNY